MLPEFVTLRIWVEPTYPSPWKAGRVNHGVDEIDVAPDNVSGIHTPDFEHHGNGYTADYNRRAWRSKATAQEYTVYAQSDGEYTETNHGRVDLCHVTLNSGERIQNVIGTRAAVRRLLRPPACPDAGATGVTLRVTNGVYVLHGECSGDVTLRSADGALTLDPARLAGDEWIVMKGATRNTLNYRFQIVVTAAATWTPQQWVPPAEPSGAGAWNDLVGTNSLQAQTRIRVKP